MAFRRHLTIKSKLFTNHRFTPSISHFNHEPSLESHNPNEKSNIFHQTRSFGVYSPNSNTLFPFRDPKWSQLTSIGFLSARNMSTSIGDGDGIEIVANAVPVVSEVAVAAADSWLPVAALQYAIDGIHNFTGLNWWASIVITTLVIRTSILPVMINQMKASATLAKLQPDIEKINNEMNAKNMNPRAVAEGRQKMKNIFKEHGVSPYSPLKGMFIQAPVFISFFLAIRKMVEKVPSFQTGGTSWFLDLTTSDTTHFLPFLTAFTFWLNIECNMVQSGGGKYGGIMKNVSRGFAVLTVPLTLTFPKGLFCYWITTNLYSLVSGLIMKQDAVKKLLNIPIIVPQTPPPGGQNPVFGSDVLKKYAAMQKHLSDKSGTNSRISLSSSVLSNRIENLEKQVKGRTKKKRK